jgi:predicted acylesterase/phospholipase RssA
MAISSNLKTTSADHSTRFFKNSLGVFQGGGCRAAAFIGAFAEATTRGVRFSEVAGTSAGSIVAALVGAGASPEALEDLVRELDFSRFLAAPKEFPESRYSRTLTLLLRATPWSKYRFILERQGLHSSSQIETWLDEQLRELLHVDAPVRFSDLPIPTHVIATDLVRRDIKVWSSRDTPNDEVAKAVRASCSIPGFFQLVDERYIDGGLLSNLPAFVYSRDEASRTSRVLAFALRSEASILDSRNLSSIAKATLGTLTDGAQALQMRLQSHVHTVAIPTGDIEATDFDKMDRNAVEILIENGRTAAGEFLDAELTNVRMDSYGSRVHSRADDLYRLVAEQLSRPVDELLVSETDTRWVYFLFIALLRWRMRGVRIRVLVSPDDGTQRHAPYQRSLLRALGVEISEVRSPLTRAFIFNPEDQDSSTAIVRVPSDDMSLLSSSVVCYSGRIDSAAIRALTDKIHETSGDFAPSIGQPRIEECNPDEVIAAIKRVPQYSSGAVDVSFETVALSKLVSLSSAVREFKYIQIEQLASIFEEAGLTQFSLAIVRFANGTRSILTPPVFEESGGRYVIIEGSTRSVYCRDRKLLEIPCVVASGVEEPLPAKIHEFSRVGIVTGDSSKTSERYSEFNYGSFRHIENKVHTLTDLEEPEKATR